MTKKTIMVVDDEEDLRKTIRALLEHEGYNVITAVNADDCLKKLEKNEPDLILMDIMMPGTPVKEIIPKIKEKIIYLSVMKYAEAESQGLLSPDNVLDFIEKPYEIDDIIKRVKDLVGE